MWKTYPIYFMKNTYVYVSNMFFNKFEINILSYKNISYHSFIGRTKNNFKVMWNNGASLSW